MIQSKKGVQHQKRGALSLDLPLLSEVNYSSEELCWFTLHEDLAITILMLQTE